MISNEKADHKAAAFAWETGTHINRGMKVVDSEGYVCRVLDGIKGRWVWGIWDFLWPLGEPYYEFTQSSEYLEQVSLQEAKELLKSEALGERYDVDRRVNRKEMAAHIDEADSFPELFKRVRGF